MKLEVNVTKKRFFVLLGAVLLLAGSIAVYAVPAGVTVGHDASEIYLSGGADIEASITQLSTDVSNAQTVVNAVSGLQVFDFVELSKDDGAIKNNNFELSCPSGMYVYDQKVTTLAGSTGACRDPEDVADIGANAVTLFGTFPSGLRVSHVYGGSTGGYSNCRLTITCVNFGIYQYSLPPPL